MLYSVVLCLSALHARALQIDTGLAASLNFTNRPPTLTVDGDGSAKGPGAPWRPPPKMVQKGAASAQMQYPRTAMVNLDLPPRKRWALLMNLYQQEIITHVQDWQKVLADHTEIEQEAWAHALQQHTKPEYLEEMMGIVDTLDHPDVNLANLLLLSSVYELGSPVMCSEVLAATIDGTVIHGRNLDYKIIAPMVEVTYVRGGKPVFTSPMYLGLISIHTGIKHGKWTYGTNTRIMDDDTPKNTLRRAQQGGWPQGLLARSVFDADYDYDYSVAAFRDATLIRSAYFIFGGAGPYQGAVLSRWWDPSFRHIEELTSTGKWWIFQGNTDLYKMLRPWEISTKSVTNTQVQLSSIERTLIGQEKMATLGGQLAVNPTKVFEVMHAPPIYMLDYNVVLFMMSAKSGTYCSVLGPQTKNDDTGIDCGAMQLKWLLPLPAIQQDNAKWFL